MEVACLLTVMKYYGGQQDARTLAEWCKVDGKYTLMGMKQAAIRAGMERKSACRTWNNCPPENFLPYFLPSMISKYRDMWFVMAFMKPLHYLGAGIRPMQYWENQMKTLWIRGITLTLFPTHEFMQKTDFQLKWWELYPWSRNGKKTDRWYEYIWLNYPGSGNGNTA